MVCNKSFGALSAALLAVLMAVAPAGAESRGPVERFTQLFGRQPAPPADYDDDAPIVRPDNGSSVRIDRLENQLRSLTGQIEQMQFQMRQLQEQLARNQSFGGRSADDTPRPMRRSDDGIPPLVAQTTPMPAVTPATTPTDPTRLRRGDAFDPTSQPNAPGAPRQIGTLGGGSSLGGSAIPQTPVSQSTRLPGGPVASDAGVPMDLSGGRLASNGGFVEPSRGTISGSALPPVGGSSALPPPGGPVTTPGGTIIASQEPFSPKDEFDMATGYLKGGQYEAAEKGYASFLQKNPKNRLVPEAVFNLGESYFQRNRHREAAEQYLKISTTYSNSSRAPDAMLRLGQSLAVLGAKEQACASFGEIPRKYPNASPTVRSSADKEAKKNAC